MKAEITHIATDSSQPNVCRRDKMEIVLPAIMVTLQLSENPKLTTDQENRLKKAMGRDYHLKFYRNKPQEVTVLVDSRKVELLLTSGWQLDFVAIAETCKSAFLYYLNELLHLG